MNTPILYMPVAPSDPVIEAHLEEYGLTRSDVRVIDNIEALRTVDPTAQPIIPLTKTVEDYQEAWDIAAKSPMPVTA